MKKLRSIIKLNMKKVSQKGSEYMKKVGEKCLLSDLKVGQRAKILKLNETNKAIRRHLLDMGVTRDTEVKIKKIAPMGDPIDISLRDYELCVSKSDLEKIEVEVLR